MHCFYLISPICRTITAIQCRCRFLSEPFISLFPHYRLTTERVCTQSFVLQVHWFSSDIRWRAVLSYCSQSDFYCCSWNSDLKKQSVLFWCLRQASAWLDSHTIQPLTLSTRLLNSSMISTNILLLTGLWWGLKVLENTMSMMTITLVHFPRKKKNRMLTLRLLKKE